MRELQLEELRMSVAKRRAMAEMRKMESEGQELALAKSRQDIINIQRACNHRKGGKDKQGIGNGNDSDYAIIKHTYSDMAPSVLCQRCQFDWRQGDTETKLGVARNVFEAGAKNHSKISFETAFNWPTDNEPSGACFFLIPSDSSALMSQVAQLKSQIAQLQAAGINL